MKEEKYNLTCRDVQKTGRSFFNEPVEAIRSVQVADSSSRSFRALDTAWAW